MLSFVHLVKITIVVGYAGMVKSLKEKGAI